MKAPERNDMASVTLQTEGNLGVKSEHLGPSATLDRVMCTPLLPTPIKCWEIRPRKGNEWQYFFQSLAGAPTGVGGVAIH